MRYRDNINDLFPKRRRISAGPLPMPVYKYRKRKEQEYHTDPNSDPDHYESEFAIAVRQWRMIYRHDLRITNEAGIPIPSRP